MIHYTSNNKYFLCYRKKSRKFERRKWGMTTAYRRIIMIIALAAIWEATSRFSSVPDFMFPSVTQVFGTMINGIVNGQIPVAVMQSIGRLLISFSLAVVIGLVLGYLIWQFEWIEDTLGFLITALQSIPNIV